MDLYIRNGCTLIDDKFQNTDITVIDGRIAEIGGQGNVHRLPELVASGMRVIPGFIDVHTHGGMGVDVNHASNGELLNLAQFFASQGTTSFLASIVTDTEENTLRCINQIKKAMDEQNGGAKLLGIHLEGPFLAFDYKGAMAERLLQKANPEFMRKCCEAAGKRLKYITVSPEVEGVPELIKELVQLGVVVAIGHSGADYDLSMGCIKDGANCSTHTFNGMKWMHQHAPAISGAVLESDIYCEAICDGRHLHPGIVRLLLKIKGLNRVVVVTDSIMATGLADGRYELGVNDIEVINGDAKLVTTGMRAGSTLTMIGALKNLMKFTGKSLEELIPLLSYNPASLMKIDDSKGSISVGKDADLVLLDNDLNVNTTIVSGRIVFKGNS